MVSNDLDNLRFAIAGFGNYKRVHDIPGLGIVWVKAMEAIHHADEIIFVGFSMSDFDGMARYHMADAIQNRKQAPKRVLVIDPCADDAMQKRYELVFERVELKKQKHEYINWDEL